MIAFRGEVKLQVLLSGITLTLLCLSTSARALSPHEVFTRFGPSVVVLESIDEQGQALGSHSGTLIGAERLVARCSAIETATRLRVSTKSGDLDAKIFARDRERNLCLIQAPGLNALPIPQATEPPAVGSRIFALSNALGLGVGISEGVVAGIRHFPAGAYIQFSAPISPGSEGGALVDEQGRLVGVIDYRRRDGQNVNFASVAAWIGDIEARDKAGKQRLERFDRAMTLLKQKQWAELEAMASLWHREDVGSPDAWRFSIEAAKGRNDAESEQRGWEALYRIDPSSTEAGVGLGRRYLSSGNTKDALNLARKLLIEHAGDASFWLFQGQAQQASGQPKEAEQSFQRALEIDPWLTEAYHHIADLAQSRGDAKTAIAIYRRLSGLYPNHLPLFINLTRAYLVNGQLAQAWTTLAQVPADRADDAAVWYWKGVTLSRIGATEEAIKAYQKSLDRKLPASDWAWAGIGFELADERRFPEAIAAFRSAEKLAPDVDEWRYQLVVNLKDSGRAGEALTIVTELVKKQPDEAKNWRQHGFVLAVLGRTAESIPSMEKSLQLDPRQAKVWGALIETYQKEGRREDAVRAYNQLRSLDGKMAEETYRSSILPYEERL
ncbi:tetratricopeptide repeat protein [Hydrogenophaga sp.]|uniref:tetratricopeptide repeat protein n=1 Tax=Hydrogenophaga sp. TaxID=1904254 RepID=UPI002FC75BE7